MKHIGKWVTRLFTSLLIIFCFSSSVALAQDDYDDVDQAPVNNTDKFEKINRIIFRFNQRFDKYILKPTATFYNYVMPRPLSLGVDNFFANVNDVPGVMNDALQGHFYQATADSWRVMINSTVGVAGLFDVADGMGLEDTPQDFGLTLAQWGYTDTNYLVVPFFIGNYTVRDALGFGVDLITSPLYFYPQQPNVTNSLIVVRFIDKRASYLRFQGVYDQMALDPYVLARSFYFQQRNYQIELNKQHSDHALLTQGKSQEKQMNQEEDTYLDE